MPPWGNKTEGGGGNGGRRKLRRGGGGDDDNDDDDNATVVTTNSDDDDGVHCDGSLRDNFTYLVDARMRRPRSTGHFTNNATREDVRRR
jgi:hypothetical protein